MQTKGLLGVVGLSGAVLAAAVAPALAAPRVMVNGKEVRGAEAYLTGGHVMVPVRGVIENIPGTGVEWNGKIRQLWVRRGDTRVKLNADSGYAQVNGESVPIGVPVSVRDGKAWMPLRFVSEVLGAAVTYDTQRQMVNINAQPGQARALGYRSAPDPMEKEAGRVAIGGEVIFTFQTPAGFRSVEERASTTTDRLNDGLTQAAPQRYGRFSPASIWMAQAQGNPTIMLGKTAITQVTAEDAKAAGMTQQALAEKWAGRMRSILAKAYNGR